MPFPSSPVLDTFDRADENPIAGWTTGPPASGMKVVSNVMTGQAAGSNGAYLPTIYAGDVEMYATLSVEGGWVDILHYLFDPLSGSDTQLGYAIITNFPSSGQVSLCRRAVGSWVVNATASWTFAANDSLGVTKVGNLHSLYAKASGGSWALLASAVDSVLPMSGRLGVTTDRGTGAAYNDYGGGPLPAIVPYTRQRMKVSVL